jgi:uncharacterized protein (DUF58 family)
MIKEALLKFFKLEGLMDNLSEYLETRVELVKYELKEDFAHALSKIGITVVAGLLLILFILFVSISIAFILADRVGLYGGFAIVGGGYLLVLVLVILFREPLRIRLEREIKKSFKRKHHEHTGNGRSD